MPEKTRELRGANMEIDFSPAEWEQDKCPWGPDKRCAVKGVSICEHFRGIKGPDIVLCAYPGEGDA